MVTSPFAVVESPEESVQSPGQGSVNSQSEIERRETRLCLDRAFQGLLAWLQSPTESREFWEAANRLYEGYRLP